MIRNRTAILGLSALLITAVLMGACGKSKQEAPPKKSAIRVGYLNIMAGVPLLLAQERGYFTDEGLNVELIEFKTGNEVATAAIAKEIDVIGGAATNAVLDASAASGTVMRIFLANEYTIPIGDRPETDLLISSEGIKTIEDLRGRIVGIYPGSVGRAFAAVVFPKLGLEPGAIEIVEVPAAQMLTALRSGSVQAVTALEPQATIILANGGFNILVKGYYGQAMPRVPASGSWFIAGRLSTAEEHAFAKAMFRAVDAIEQNRTAADRILIERQGVPPELAGHARLQLWAPIKGAEVKQLLGEYLEFLRQHQLTSYTGSDWIWESE